MEMHYVVTSSPHVLAKVMVQNGVKFAGAEQMYVVSIQVMSYEAFRLLPYRL